MTAVPAIVVVEGTDTPEGVHGARYANPNRPGQGWRPLAVVVAELVAEALAAVAAETDQTRKDGAT
jgi:hypothetical protein